MSSFSASGTVLPTMFGTATVSPCSTVPITRVTEVAAVIGVPAAGSCEITRPTRSRRALGQALTHLQAEPTEDRYRLDLGPVEEVRHGRAIGRDRTRPEAVATEADLAVDDPARRGRHGFVAAIEHGLIGVRDLQEHGLRRGIVALQPAESMRK